MQIASTRLGPRRTQQLQNSGFEPEPRFFSGSYFGPQIPLGRAPIHAVPQELATTAAVDVHPDRYCTASDLEDPILFLEHITPLVMAPLDADRGNFATPTPPSQSVSTPSAVHHRHGYTATEATANG